MSYVLFLICVPKEVHLGFFVDKSAEVLLKGWQWQKIDSYSSTTIISFPWTIARR